MPSYHINTLNKILFWLIWGFMACLYWQPLMIGTNVFSGLIFLSFFLTPFTVIKETLKKRWHVIIMLLFFGWSIISVLLSHNKQSGWDTIQLRSPLFLFACSLGVLRIPRELFNKLLYWFCLFTLLAAVVCLVSAIGHFIRSGNSAYLYNDALTGILNKQSIYIATLVNLAIFSHVYLMRVSSLQIFKTTWPYISILLLFVFSFLLAGRNAMVVLYTFSLVYVFGILFRQKKYLEMITLVMGIIIGLVVLLKMFPKTLNRFKELTYTNYHYNSDAGEAHYAGNLTAEQWNGANFRLAVWQCGWELARQDMLTGAGLGDRKDKILQIYKQKNFILAIKTQKNLHNQYLDILSSLGIIGLLLFITGFIIGPLLYAYKQKNILAIAVILTFAFALVTDNFLDRSFSTIIFSFFIPFVLTRNDQE